MQRRNREATARQRRSPVQERPRELSHTAAAVGYLAILLVLQAPVLLLDGSQQAWLWEDTLEYSYPVRNFAAVEMRSGTLPLWDPYTFCGMPVLADIGAGLLYPPNLALSLFARGGLLPYRVLEWQLMLHVWLAGFGTYLVARRFLRSSWGAAFAGLVFMLSGFVTSHLIHLSVVQAVSWLPFVIALSWSAQERRSVLRAAGAGALVALSVYAGHPQTSAFLATAAALVSFFHAAAPGTESPRGPAARRVARAMGLLAVTAVVTVALAAPQLLPGRELLPLTVRQEMSYEASSECSFSPLHLITLFAPNYYGKAHGGDWRSYWGPGMYFHYWELNAFVGIAPLFLALLSGAIARRDGAGAPEDVRRAVRFFWVLAAFGFILALGRFGFLHPLFHAVAPLYRRFRIPARALVFFDFAMAMLAGAGLARLLGEAGRVPRERMTRWMGVFALLLVLALAMGGLLLRGRSANLMQAGPRARGVAEGALLQAFLAGTATLALLYLAAAGRLRGTRAAAALCAAAFLDLAAFGWGYTFGRVSPSEFYTAGREEILKGLREEGRDEFFRVNSRPIENPEALVLRRNQGLIYGVYTMEGYNQLKLAAFQGFEVPAGLNFDLFNVKYRSLVTPDNQLMLMLNPSYLPRAFLVPEAAACASEAEVLARMNEDGFDPARTVLLLPGGQDDVAAEAARWSATVGEDAESAPDSAHIEAAIIEHRPNRVLVRVNAPRPMALVLSEIWFPGWRARADGEELPVYRADYCLRAVLLPAGERTVEVFMTSAPFRRGLVPAALTGAGCVLALAFALRRRRAAPKDSGSA